MGFFGVLRFGLDFWVSSFGSVEMPRYSMMKYPKLFFSAKLFQRQLPTATHPRKTSWTPSPAMPRRHLGRRPLMSCTTRTCRMVPRGSSNGNGSGCCWVIFRGGFRVVCG